MDAGHERMTRSAMAFGMNRVDISEVGFYSKRSPETKQNHN